VHDDIKVLGVAEKKCSGAQSTSGHFSAAFANTTNIRMDAARRRGQAGGGSSTTTKVSIWGGGGLDPNVIIPHSDLTILETYGRDEGYTAKLVSKSGTETLQTGDIL
jgi:hypothetical protein